MDSGCCKLVIQQVIMFISNQKLLFEFQLGPEFSEPFQ